MLADMLIQHIKDLQKEIRKIKKQKGYRDSAAKIIKVNTLDREIKTLKLYIGLAKC